MQICSSRFGKEAGPNAFPVYYALLVEARKLMMEVYAQRKDAGDNSKKSPSPHPPATTYTQPLHRIPHPTSYASCLLPVSSCSSPFRVCVNLLCP